MATGRSGATWRRLVEQVKLTQPHICYLCSKPIDLSLHHFDPLSFTVDHVIPIAEDPSRAEDPTNLRPAHRRCNSSKGVGGFTAAKFSRQWK